MSRIVGLNPIKGVSKKTGKPFDAVMVSYVEDYPVNDAAARGLKAGEEYVQRTVFDAAAEGRKLDELLDCECTFVYGRTGYLDALYINAET